MKSSSNKMQEIETTALYECSFGVRWGDMDVMGHVNNTLYFRYCEQARMEWFATLDLSTCERPDSKIVIVNAFCEFRVPVVYPANLTVEVRGGSAGHSSFMSYYTIRDQLSHAQSENAGTAESVVYANGQAKVVWVDRAGTRSVPLPSLVRDLLPED